MKLKAILTASAALCALMAQGAGEELTGTEIEARPSASVVEPLSLTNPAVVHGFQCDITPDAGLVIDPSAITATDRAGTHTLQASQLDGGTILVTAYHPDLEPVGGSEGPLLNVPVKMPAADGTYNIAVSYIVLATEDGRKQLPDINIPVSVNTDTGIDGVDVDIVGDDQWFDLKGIRLTNPQRGIVIHRNGNKVTKEYIR